MKLSLVSTDWQPWCVCTCTSYLVFPPRHLCGQQPRAVSMSICVGGMTLWSPSYTLASTTGISGCWLKPNSQKMFCTSFMYSTQPFPSWTVYEFTVRQQHNGQKSSQKHTHITAFLRSIKCTLEYRAIWPRSHTNKLFISIAFTSKCVITFINMKLYIRAVTEKYINAWE